MAIQLVDNFKSGCEEHWKLKTLLSYKSLLGNGCWRHSRLGNDLACSDL
jgi:hypothetical protein